MHMAAKAGQVQLLPINTHPAGSLPTPQANRPDPCHTPFLSLPFPSAGRLFPQEGQLLTRLWPELGASFWSVAQLGWGLLAGVLSPFLQRQLSWLGLHLAF